MSIPVPTDNGTRKRLYIRLVWSVAEIGLYLTDNTRALQSDSVTVLVGPMEEAFHMPQDLLIQYSKPLGKMCSSGFLESCSRIIRLPEIAVPTFEDFLVWVYAYEPSIDGSKSVDTLIDLAVFGEIYLIHHLKNQTSDAIRAAIGKSKWAPNPDVICKVYRSVPPGSTLRKLCSHGFTFRPEDNDWGHRNPSTRKYGECSDWKPVFEELAEFGWDYFQTIQRVPSEASDISWGGACRFHDHSERVGWEWEGHFKCPFIDSWSSFDSYASQVPEESSVFRDEGLVEVEGIYGDHGS